MCVVAGACSAIGSGVANRLAREGGIVVGVDRISHSVGALALVADLTIEDQVADAFSRVHQAFGRVDVIFNNAGLVDPDDHSVLDMAATTWDSVFTANLTTTWLSCKHGIPYMLRNDPSKGSVINTASFLAGMGAATAQMAYNAAKAAVAQLSRDLGVQLVRRSVRVNALALGPIATPQLMATFNRVGPEQAARRFMHMPLSRFGTIEELGATVAYLASNDAGFVTGSVLPLHGGIPQAFTVPE